MNFKQFINEALEVYYKPFVDTHMTGDRLVYVKNQKGKIYTYKINQDQYQRIEAYRQPNGKYRDSLFVYLKQQFKKQQFKKPEKQDDQLKLFN